MSINLNNKHIKRKYRKSKKSKKGGAMPYGVNKQSWSNYLFLNSLPNNIRVAMGINDPFPLNTRIRGQPRRNNSSRRRTLASNIGKTALSIRNTVYPPIIQEIKQKGEILVHELSGDGFYIDLNEITYDKYLYGLVAEKIREHFNYNNIDFVNSNQQKNSLYTDSSYKKFNFDLHIYHIETNEMEINPIPYGLEGLEYINNFDSLNDYNIFIHYR